MKLKSQRAPRKWIVLVGVLDFNLRPRAHGVTVTGKRVSKETAKSVSLSGRVVQVVVPTLVPYLVPLILFDSIPPFWKPKTGRDDHYGPN
jgi:hypothetical protein